ncbi:cerebellin-1 [Xyrichtys novacula]|uniref:Cerebellin-1 n=1 Tax=Xyrichtys novacula TaxID=13765 RepID=A0AAV1FY15_XYRNO|nr:cerebellin-1 [Xyrichtys novacula]
MFIVPALFLLRALFLCGHVEAQSNSSTLDIMKNAALSLTEPLTCDKWDCDCAFKRQRSCCCGANDMFELEDKTFERITNLWIGVSSLKYSVMEFTAGFKVSFKASMDPADATSQNCFGIFTSNVPIPYSTVSLNDGFGYNPTLGLFTAPRAGVYVFSATVYSYVGETGRLRYKVQMMKNGELIVSVWEDNREDTEDSATLVTIVELKRGDQVYMELMVGRRLCSNLPYNVFTGFMLYPETEELTA